MDSILNPDPFYSILTMTSIVSSPLKSLIAQSEEPGGLNRLSQSAGSLTLAILDDVSLIQLLTLGRVDALSELYDRYSRMVLSLALNTVGDAAVAEEIVQDVFMRVWEKAGTYDARIAKVSTWLTSITRHRAIDEFRKGNRRLDQTSISWVELSPGDSPNSPGPEEETELSLQNKTVRQAMNSLSPGEREALALAYFKGYSQSEIARYLGLPLGTVKTRIRTAMRKLRLVLSQTLQEDG
jgi:RNA polymerase sigma-70 factor (ECF subfamily)